MIAKFDKPQIFRLFICLMSVALALSLGSAALAQEDAEDETYTGDPVMLGFQIARDLIEEDLGQPLYILRWRYYEDNWSTNDSWRVYGSFGIDNCAADVPFSERRSDILFGWTISILDVSGHEYQARVSYDLQDTALCDEAIVPPQYAPPPVAEPPPAEAVSEAEGETAPAAASTASTSGFALGGHIAGFDGATASQMKQAGMTWVKKQVKHGESDGRDVINQAHANGFKVLLGALGNKDRLAQDFDGYVAEFAKYVAFLAQLGADGIEVWNEPNIEREWPYNRVNGGEYAKLLKAAYAAIKAVNPNVLVVSGAPAPTGYAGAAGCLVDDARNVGVCNDDVFMQQMAQAGAAQHMDCLGLHYNEGVLSPTQNSGDPRGGYPTYYFSRMLSRGAQYFPNSKVCWTELGYLSGEGMPSAIPAGFDWTPHDPITVAEQAQWLAEAARLSRDSGRVSLMIVWNVNFTHWGTDPQAGYAIVRPGGGCPACATLRAAVS